MARFLALRLVEALSLVVGVTAVTFALMATTSGGVARQIVGPTAPESVVRAKEAALGMHHPLWVRYGDWLGQALHGNLGTSWNTGESVRTLLSSKAPITLSLVISTILVSALLSLIIGVTAAVRGGWLDRSLSVLSVAGFAFPSFVLALVLALVFAVNLHWLPAIGYVPLTHSPSGWLKSVTLPVAALAIAIVASTSLQLRGAMIDVVQSDFVRTLRSRGVSSRSLYLKHALRSAAPSALTILGLQTIGLVGGTVVVERVFALQGLGTAVVDGSTNGDVPVVMGVVLILVGFIAVVNSLLDIAYALLNPKVRTLDNH